MFTGLVEALGTVRQRRDDGAGVRLCVTEPHIAQDAPLGASIAVNGVCLTVVERDPTSFAFQIGPETLRCTNLGELRPGDRVNLERSLRAGDRLGGHIVQGHVDGTGAILARAASEHWELVEVSLPAELARYVVTKGSVCVDGVSLTVVEVKGDSFTVSLIPETLARTTLGLKEVGDPVNLEVDVIAKYVEKLVQR